MKRKYRIKNKCKCGKIIDKRSKHCHSCENKSRKMSVSAKLKVSQFQKKKWENLKKHYYCIDCLKKGIKTEINYRSKRCRECFSNIHLRKRFCKCGKEIAKYNRTGNCGSCAHKGIKSPHLTQWNIQHLPKPYWTKYRNTWFRSGWEANFAKLLTFSGYKWRYEFTKFFFDNTSYTPDFYIPEWDLYIEIKGWYSNKNKRKMRRFKHLFSKINLIILTENIMKEILYAD